MRRVSLPAALSLSLGLSACAPEGSTAYVSFNVPPSSDCTVAPVASGRKFISVGVFDISKANDTDSVCRNSYYMHLLANSNLRANANAATGRSEPNVLQVHSAEVTLMTLQKEPIDFETGAKNPLPNPFLVVTNNTLSPSDGADPSIGIVPIDAIPADYGAQLFTKKFVGQQILVEVQVFGTTVGDVDVDFKPFVFPVELCKDCLRVCKKVVDMLEDPESVFGDDCKDNAGADGRVCVDPDC